MNLRNVGVIGAGIMGHGIAQIASMTGYKVFLHDIERKGLEKAIEKIKISLSLFVKKGKISEDESNNIIKRITTTTNLRVAVQDSDYVI